MVTAPARRELVRNMMGQGTERAACAAVVGMSASAFATSRAGSQLVLREPILALAHRHRRYGVGMIYLKLRQRGWLVNHKRVERLYHGGELQVRRRKRKKVPVGERQPLMRPTAANEVWSMDFVFDRTAEGRVIKCLTIVDDATHEAVAIEPERAIGGLMRDAHSGPAGGHPWLAAGDPHRQRQGVLRHGHADLGAYHAA